MRRSDVGLLLLGAAFLLSAVAYIIDYRYVWIVLVYDTFAVVFFYEALIKDIKDGKL